MRFSDRGDVDFVERVVVGKPTLNYQNVRSKLEKREIFLLDLFHISPIFYSISPSTHTPHGITL